MRIALRPSRAVALATANDVLLSTLKWHTGCACGSLALVVDAKHSLTDVVVDTGALMIVDRPLVVQRAFSICIITILCTMGVGFFKDAWMLTGTKAAQRVSRKTLSIILLVQAAVAVSKESIFRMTRRVSEQHKSLTLASIAQHQRADVFASMGVCTGAAMTALGCTWTDRAIAMALGCVMIRTAKTLWDETFNL